MVRRYWEAMGFTWRSARRLVVAVLALVAVAAGGASARAATSLGSFQITYYWFVPESRFVGKPVAAPGLTGHYREDFLYGAAGVPMQGTGTAADGTFVHYAGTSGGYWVNAAGARTAPGAHGWSHGPPYWRDGGWRNAAGAPTFKRANRTWSNGKGVTFRTYHDRFGPGKGVPVTEWHSIATDPSVIPKGTRVYVAALAGSPAGGCFVAEDRGSAIIGLHIDVLVPADTNLAAEPHSGDLVTLAPGDACPPVMAPQDLGTLGLRYLVPARKRGFGGAAVHLTSPKLTLPETFLYSARGVVRHRLGEIPGARRLIFAGGGWWVNAAGARTDQAADGSWTNGSPVWREGGYRNRRGAPTRRLTSGRWSNGRGVVLLPYHERFRLASATEWIAWRSAGAPRALVGVGTLLRIAGLPSTGCLRVDHAALSRGVIEVVVPYGTATSALPIQSDVTALPPDAAAACAG